MITEVITLRHIAKVTLSHVFSNAEFELWCDIDADYWSLIRENIKIKQMPTYELFIGHNMLGLETANILFTWVHFCIERSKTEDTKLALPLVLKNTSPIDLSKDYHYRFYEYLENNPIAKTMFLGLGNPRNNYDLEDGHRITLKRNGNPESMEFHDKIKQFLGLRDTQFWYATDFIFNEYQTEK